MKELFINAGKFDLVLQYNARSFSSREINKLKDLFVEILPLLQNFIGRGVGLKLKNVESIELSLLICGDAKMKQINHQFRGKNKTTDVLSFPVFDDLRNDKVSLENPLHVLCLGDLIISKDKTAKQAKEFKITWEQELIHLFVHGLLHLLGYDHELNETEEKLMFSLEEKLVKKIYDKIM